jgi:hypothetical protein
MINYLPTATWLPWEIEEGILLDMVHSCLAALQLFFFFIKDSYSSHREGFFLLNKGDAPPNLWLLLQLGSLFIYSICRLGLGFQILRPHEQGVS